MDIKVYLVGQNSLKNYEKVDIFESLKFKGNYKQIAFLPESKQVFVGTTFETENKFFDPFNKVDFFNLGAVLINSLAKTKITDLKLEFVDPELNFDNQKMSSLLLGMYQASWNFDKYLDPKKAKSKELSVSFSPEIQKLVSETDLLEVKILNDNLNLVRYLVDSTPEDINPQSIIDIVKQNLGDKSNVSLEIWDSKDLEKNKLNGVLFVGRASRYQPTMVQARLKPKGEVKNKIVLVGKGVTYDSGGLDIKSDGHMKTMKMDMAGSSTMFGVIKALAELGLENTEVYWISAFAENMVAGNSYKSDDVITSYSGQTIEINNTDAEGRLLLADCLALATTLDPDYIIDAATLTGACVVALSERYTGLMSNDQQLSDSLFRSFVEENEHATQVILPEIFRSEVHGDISDLINTSKLRRMVGHITAGLFLSHFVDQKLFRNPEMNIKTPKNYSWAHLDIAGSAMNNKQNSLECNGATAQSVRSLINWVRGVDSRK